MDESQMHYSVREAILKRLHKKCDPFLKELFEKPNYIDRH